jgi:hypothetical protein
VAAISEDVAARGTALEYWFLKLHSGDLAFLVDFIGRRAIGEAEVRLSLWVRGTGRVEHHRSTAWSADGHRVVVDDCEFTAHSSQGAVGDVEWDVQYDAGRSRVAPRVPLLSRLHPFDLDLISYPRTQYTGSVTVAGERFELADTPGSVTHYWGRRLPDRWHWISANAFTGTDLVVEAVLMRTRFWGARPALTAGYLWTAEAGREHTLVSPLNGLMSIAGNPEAFTLIGRGPRGTTRLQGSAAAAQYNDLAEGIQQTLHGSLTVVGRGLTDPHAGLEHRNWG